MKTNRSSYRYISIEFSASIVIFGSTVIPVVRHLATCSRDLESLLDVEPIVFPIEEYRYVKKAVILLSGGLDSTTCLALAKSENFTCYALSFSYGQRHTAELEAALRVAQHIKVAAHQIINLDSRLFGGSALTDMAIKVPDFKESKEIPITYVPARNTVFLAMALSVAESIEAQDIFIGVSSVDYSHYPDCRPEFIRAFQSLANLATKTGVNGKPITIHTPLQYLSKAETIVLGSRLGVDYRLTVSCYQATAKGEACGDCDSCIFRKKGFLEAGITDPTRYQTL